MFFRENREKAVFVAFLRVFFTFFGPQKKGQIRSCFEPFFLPFFWHFLKRRGIWAFLKKHGSYPTILPFFCQKSVKKSIFCQKSGFFSGFCQKIGILSDFAKNPFFCQLVLDSFLVESRTNCHFDGFLSDFAKNPFFHLLRDYYCNNRDFCNDFVISWSRDFFTAHAGIFWEDIYNQEHRQMSASINKFG